MISLKYSIEGATMYIIEIYEDVRGKSEIKEYVKRLQEQHNKNNSIKLNKIISYIRKLREYGLNLGVPYIKHIKDDIWELRPLKDRILFAYYKENKFVLLSCFIKKTKKTPDREIKKAKRLLQDYKKRSEKNEERFFRME